jgi:hypothetical protein
MRRGTWGWLAWLCCAPVLAHHSFAMFDKTQTRSVSGTLYAVEWQNPHSWIWVEVKSDAGAKVWGFEGGSPVALTHMGYSKKNLLVGTKVTVSYNPLKDGRSGGNLVDIKFN